MTTRRETLAAGAALAVAAATPGRAASKPVRIGYLATGSDESNATFLAAFRDALRARGWVDGRDFVLVPRFAGDNAGLFPELAATLVRERSDLIVGTCIPSTRAAKQATASIPIVMSVNGDPVAAGLVASLARPGANVTGMSTLFESLIPKWLELLRLAVPGSRQVAMMSNPDSAADAYMSARFDDAAKVVGVVPIHVEARTKSQIPKAFAEAAQRRADGLVVMTEAFLAGQERIIVPFASRYRIPAIYGFREFVEAGGLMSYGMSYRDYFRELSHYVDAVLRGRKPADLPVEQPTSIELAINAATARDLAIALPPELLARADRVVN
jgi:putative ABC transport system substrate-binding protein